MDTEYRDELVTAYFNLGLMYRDICWALAIENGIVLSDRHLKRILKNMDLRRRNYDNIQRVIDFVVKQIQESGQLHGYRWMFQKCLCQGIFCRKEDVRIILGILDPRGTEQRRKRRLIRRRYSAKGPNYIWHLDSYDKLRRYGIFINGCIDGFSRKIIWMNVYNTSNNPRVIAGYYMESVMSLGGFPRIVRGDKCTENCQVKEFQRYFRRNGIDERMGLSSYLEGRSTANQRIEYWWSFLRRECTDYWICLFQQLIDDGEFTGSFLDVNLVQFCFMHLIQHDLDSTVETWNCHKIRQCHNSRNPAGRPSIMYHLPGLYGTVDYICESDPNEVNNCKQQCLFRKVIPCDVTVHDLSCFIMAEANIDHPKSSTEATRLYIDLRREINQYI